MPPTSQWFIEPTSMICDQSTSKEYPMNTITLLNTTTQHHASWCKICEHLFPLDVVWIWVDLIRVRLLIQALVKTEHKELQITLMKFTASSDSGCENRTHAGWYQHFMNAKTFWCMSGTEKPWINARGFGWADWQIYEANHRYFSQMICREEKRPQKNELVHLSSPKSISP